ncbi:MAG: peptidoglycan-N-acetylglucosamine deacetylase [Thermosediminibacterales bacterium]|nr:peptidoglycan-N-acetylglucosamine deacetylase [Thermosediminibacterales bacterium]MDK2835914.1 peptidoglycan-N-acetylglucosamine deacetylase [Thermosediminibacterales bacterium]
MSFLTVVVIGVFSITSPDVVAIFGHSKKLVPIYRVNTPEKKLSISFDAAWGADHTPEILRVLREHNIKTTFFLVGFWVEDYPEMAKKIAEEGHEIGNHSSTHPNMGGLSEQKILRELKQAHDIIKKYTGYEPKLFRPPFGDYSNRLIKTTREFGYEVIQWDVDSLDWKDLSAKAIEDRVLKKVKKGSIVLFHNNGKNTAKAIVPIIEKLQSKGYKIVPISELLIKGNYYIDHTGEQQPGSS